MIVAARSISECAASERMASEPDKTPTIALAIVRPAEAAMEPSATRSLSFNVHSSDHDRLTARFRIVNLSLRPPCPEPVSAPFEVHVVDPPQERFAALPPLFGSA